MQNPIAKAIGFFLTKGRESLEFVGLEFGVQFGGQFAKLQTGLQTPNQQTVVLLHNDLVLTLTTAGEFVCLGVDHTCEHRLRGFNEFCVSYVNIEIMKARL